MATVSPELPPLVGQAPAFLELLEQVSRVAPLDRPILVIGERGTGKELIASRLHYLSPRWDRPLVKLNAAALPETLLDSELFGHEAGAFTGAIRQRRGRFELADGGSLFVDEIASTSLAVQERLLRVVEYGALERVGGSAHGPGRCAPDRRDQCRSAFRGGSRPLPPGPPGSPGVRRADSTAAARPA